MFVHCPLKFGFKIFYFCVAFRCDLSVTLISCLIKMKRAARLKWIEAFCHPVAINITRKCAFYLLFSWRLATWLTDECSQSAPAFKHASLDSQQNVNQARGRPVFENNGEALWSCANRSETLSSRGVVYFVCLRGWSYLSLSERSIVIWFKKKIYEAFCRGWEQVDELSLQRNALIQW